MNFFRKKEMSHPIDLEFEPTSRSEHTPARLSTDPYEPPPEVEAFAPKIPLPGYVEPRPDVPPVGAISAEAIVRDCEKTAKDVDAMAADLIDAFENCAAELVDLVEKFKALKEEVQVVVNDIKETSAAYRDEAKTVFLRIEDTALRMKEVRELSAAMRARLAPATTDSGSLLPVLNITGDNDATGVITK